MSLLYIILNSVFILVCLGLITVILLQKKSSQGLGSVAGMGNSETVNRNLGRTQEDQLEKFTKIGGAILLVSSIALCLVK
ncbi:MAG: preprotein translocase subunit SecG [Clostridiales bacterium]|jgi:protein translocase SecG subunit|nr:preprotein translocase subunit SecG [Clostridiales bacterium]